jgi:hypothetical protein
MKQNIAIALIALLWVAAVSSAGVAQVRSIESRLNAPDFVRKQLSPIAGGLSAHLDTSYSQAKGRFVYGANVEGIPRSERNGFGLGHEIRINTDLEYVLLLRVYRAPEHELFAIFETTYVYRRQGRAEAELWLAAARTSI